MTALNSLLREPLVHFLLVGAAVFIAFDLASPPAERADPDAIVIDERVVLQLSTEFDAVWRRPPSSEELDTIIEDFIKEEVLVREAIALGMDRGDAVIRRRLRQKMDFLAGSAVEGQLADEAELEAYFAEHQERYQQGPRVTLEHIFMGEVPGDEAIARILGQLSDGASPRSLGERSLMSPVLKSAPRQEVDGVFGAGFFEKLSAVTPGTWTGPVQSGYGQHLVMVEDWFLPPPPDLASVRARVIQDWRREATEDLLNAVYMRLRDRYTVILQDPDPK